MDSSNDSPVETFERKKLLNQKIFEIVESNLCNDKTERVLENLLREGAEINFEDPEEDDLTPLAFAVSNEKFNTVPLLLKHGANVELSDNRLKENKSLVLSDYVFTQEKYELLTELLMNDAAFPKDLAKVNPSSVGNGWRLKVLKLITAERSKFHENIKNGKEKLVRKFVKKFEKLKCAYNSENHCALFSALDSNQFEIYSYLRSKGFRFGVDTECKTKTQSLNTTDKSKLRSLMGKYFKSPGDKHIITLVSKSQISFDNDSVHFGKIVGFFEALNEIEEIKAVLKIVAEPIKSIVFDFNQESIINLHWTGCYIEDVNGRTFYDKGQILVGAKRENKNEVLGTLAHELSHMALQIVYKNRCLPFFENSKGKTDFENIVKTDSAEQNQSEYEIITKAFRSPNFHSQCVELIVAVPHALALFRQDKNEFEKFQKKFKGLFEFYFSKVLPDFDLKCCEIDTRQEVRELNNFFGLTSEIKLYPLTIQGFKFNLGDVSSSDNVLIQCNVPELALLDLMKEQFLNKFIFIKQEKLENDKQKILEFYNNSLEKHTQPVMVVLCSNSDKVEADLAPFLAKTRIVLVSSIPEIRQIFQNSIKNVADIKYCWEDLTLECKEKILASKFHFQNHEIFLEDILGHDLNVFDEISLKEVLELPNISIEPIKSSSKIHIARKFQISPKQPVLSVEEIVDLFETPRTLVLSDSAGSGKSMSAINLAQKLKQKYPCRWVVFVDLKLCAKFFCANDRRNQMFVVEDLFKLLKLNKEVEKKIFSHCYESQKALFIFDGFDEICPFYKNFVLNLISTVQKSRNSLLVTTRTFQTQELENKLSTTAIKLMPFSERDQKDFLIQYWQSSEETQKNVITLEEKAARLLQERSVPKDFLQNPLLLYMFAEVHEKIESSHIDDTKFNAFSLYYSFVEKKIEIWLSKGPEIMKEGTNLIMRSINPIHVHQKLALDELFFKADETIHFWLPQMTDASSIEVINRIGLIKLLDNNIEFMHQTLCEYFVAMFVVNNVTKKTGICSLTTLFTVFLKVLKITEHRKIRNFINEGLETMYEKKEDYEIDYLSARFEESFREESNRDFLERIIIEKQTFLIRFFFETLKIPKQTKIDLLRFKYKEGSEILHVAASHFESFEVLWTCIESFTDRDERKILLQAKGAIGRNVVTTAVLNERVLKFVLKNILNLMTSQEWLELLMSTDNELNSALHVITSNRHSSILVELWHEVKKKLSKADQKTWFRKTGAYNETILQSLVRDNNIKMLPGTLRIVLEIFDKSEVRDFLLAEDFLGSTFLHNAARHAEVEVLKLVWNFYMKNLCKLDLQNLLMRTMGHGHNIFHKAARNLDENMISFAFEIARSTVEPENLLELLKSKNYYGKSILSLTSEKTAEIFPPELLAVIQTELPHDSQGENIPCLNDLALKIAGEVDARTLNALMVEKMENVTTIKFAAQFGSPNLMKRLIFLSEQLTKEEILDMILPDLLHFSLYNDRNKHKVCEMLFEFIVKKLPDSEVIAVFSGLDERKRTLLTLGVELNCPIFFKFAEFYKNYNSEKFKNLFFRKDSIGEILMHHVARFCNAEMAQGLFDLIFSLPFTKSDREAMLLMKSDFKRISLHRGLKGQSDTFRIFYSKYKNILGHDVLKKNLFYDDLDYFNYGNHKSEKLVNLMRDLAIQDFGQEVVNAMIHDDEIVANLEYNET